MGEMSKAELPDAVATVSETFAALTLQKYMRRRVENKKKALEKINEDNPDVVGSLENASSAGHSHRDTSPSTKLEQPAQGDANSNHVGAGMPQTQDDFKGS